jgi:5-hydroxyisourate hydrolase-like protein (transthyretin family)
MPVRSLYRVLPVVALIGLAACGSDSNPAASASEPTAENVPFHVLVDVRDNLLRHYGDAAKAYPRERQVRFDFRETSRRTEGDQAIVTGEFLFGVDDDPTRSGLIAVYFTQRNGRWARTGQYRVEEEAVQAHRLVLRIVDSVTGEPIRGVEVEARRVEGDKRTSDVRHTDSDGTVELEVFSGVFQVHARRDDYREAVTDLISVDAAEMNLRDLVLARLKIDSIPR